ncbi:alpha/beta hydrolase [Kitasatospora sp. NBC_00240]|uniref:alpha/beta hydrolase n=1 Tax=Kitasatospora sp. NBC_00240 TaxID=2903567 RepID=UPI002251CBE9|nr:alpha/beta hydrolase [Kitasatospora sp. NBC_00240]MCX5215040.1 alpha/beta hydrolase [Kitasatospora sp. NBC_00240]
MTGVAATVTLIAATLVLPTAAAAAATGTAAAATAAAADELPAAPLNWTACPFPGAPQGLQCASVQVPVDYAHPRGAKATVTVDRLPATGAHPVGSLFFDPGGPGGSGTGLVYAESLGAGLFTAATREHFDLIGLDPRGVGLSSPVRCDPALLNRQVSLFPTDEAGFQRLVERNRELGRSCRRLTGPLLEHLDTVSAARDLEVLRRALGQGPLNYLGLSYGSQLGATYAELFPGRIRTLALDGALDHSLSTTTLFQDEARAYEDSFGRFVDRCAQDTSCAPPGADLGRLLDDLVAAADRTPIPAPGCVPTGSCRPSVTGEDIRFNLQGLLLFPARQGELARALEQARNGDATAFSSPLATGPSDGEANGSAIAIECLDWPTPIRTLGDLQRLQRLGRTVAPRFGGASQSWTILAGCIGWPAPVVNPPRPATVRHAPPILITNATHDPSTAYPWAVHLARELPSSVLVTREGDGHTSYLARGAARTRDAIDTYLLTGRTPPPGTVYDD